MDTPAKDGGQITEDDDVSAAIKEAISDQVKQSELAPVARWTKVKDSADAPERKPVLNSVRPRPYHDSLCKADPKLAQDGALRGRRCSTRWSFALFPSRWSFALFPSRIWIPTMGEKQYRGAHEQTRGQTRFRAYLAHT